MSKRPRERVTISEVAKACGIAVSTVSNALSGKPYVRKETRKKVQEVAAQMGYRPSPVARALRTHRSATIGILVPDISNPVFSWIVQGIDGVVSEEGTTLFVCNTEGRVDKQIHYMQTLSDRQVDGLILVSQHTDGAEISDLLDKGPPFVLLYRRRRDAKTDFVGIDNEHGIREAMKHLIELGHRRIAFVHGPEGSTSVEERFAAYRAVVDEEGLSAEANLVFQGDYSIEGGLQAGKFFLEQDPRPTAVLASNDFSALGVVEAAGKLGYRVPEDVSVVGYDDIFIAGMPQVQLTTVYQPKRKVGAAAAKLLLQRVRSSRRGRPKDVIFPVELKVRGTTGAAYSEASAAPWERDEVLVP